MAGCIKPGSQADFNPIFKPKLSLTKVVMIWISGHGENLKMCKNPPSKKEIKVESCLSRVIPLKHLTVQI